MDRNGSSSVGSPSPGSRRSSASSLSARLPPAIVAAVRGDRSRGRNQHPVLRNPSGSCSRIVSGRRPPNALGSEAHAQSWLIDTTRSVLHLRPPLLAEGAPMSWHTWIAFVLASTAMGLVPGPGVTSIVDYAIGSGRRTALASVLGMAAGNAVAISLSLAGVGALLAASATAFSVLKWIGALYLIALGLLTFRKANSASAGASSAARPVSPSTAFLGNVAVGVFHPKTIVFFVAFVPQFISPKAAYAPQAALLALTFCTTVLVTDTSYALTASGASRWLRRPSVARWSGRASGSILVAAGVATAAARG